METFTKEQKAVIERERARVQQQVEEKDREIGGLKEIQAKNNE